MSFLQEISLFKLFVFGAGVYIVKRLIDARRSTSLPPGPTGLPLIGNLLQIPTEKQWVHFDAMSKKYGDIFCLSVLGTRYVILNSLGAITDVLEKQSIKCSDRPHLTMASDLIGASKSMLFSNYTDRFRHYRRLFSRPFGNKTSAAAFNSIQEMENRKFLRKLLQNPNDLTRQIHAKSCAIITKMAYGYSIQEGKDPFVDLATKVMTMVLDVAAPGAFLVDIFPALRYLPEWLPGTGFLQLAKKYRQLVTDVTERPHQYVVREMAAGTATPSFTSTLLEGGVTPEEEEMIRWTTVDMYIGASDTTVTAAHAFFLAMVLFPEVQVKAQAELDAVIGSERLPTFEDRDVLPYINAVCKEVFRWHAVTPIGMPHVASEDIYSNGILIPKGSLLIGNAWAVLRDETTYPDPDVFRPERFLGDAPEPEPFNVCFGFGRRICPGRHFGEAALWISIATSLAVLKISKEVVDGVEVTPVHDVLPGTISHPKPFKCRIRARSSQSRALLQG